MVLVRKYVLKVIVDSQKFIKRSFYFMKKFLSMALATIMALNVNVLSSKNIAAASFWESFYVAEGDYESDNLKFDIPKDDLKRKKIKITVEKEEESSELKIFLKFISWAAYSALLAYVGFTVATFPGLNKETKNKLREFAKANNKFLGCAQNKMNSYYNAASAASTNLKESYYNAVNSASTKLKESYYNFCPADTTNGFCDCLLKKLGIESVNTTDEA